MPKIRLIFFGSAELACPSLRALVADNGIDLLGVVTQPDRPKGRALKLHPTPLGAEAEALGLKVWKPERLRKDTSLIQELHQLQPDLIALTAYGQILPASVLDLPAHGCLNVHTSILPKYRGAAPIQWAILNGDATTGVTLMKMDEGLDTGDILATVTTPINPEDNAATLHDRLGNLGADLLVKTIPAYLGGRVQPVKQPSEGVSYARKITKADGRIRWSNPATHIWNQVRGLNPWPSAYSYLSQHDGPLLVKILNAKVSESPGGAPGQILKADKGGIVVRCGQGALCISNLQREGGKKMPVAQFLAGYTLDAAQRFLSAPSDEG